MRLFPLSILLILTTILPASAQKKIDFYLDGYVKEALGKTDLTDAMIIMNDSTGNSSDTIRMSGLRWRNGQEEKIASYYIPVERKDSTYVFDVVCEGYEPYTLVYDLRNIGKRERYRTLPTVYLKRAPRTLDELTVTRSKIKFYNKGDTIVFNADAFQLAEGSMLDALIAQLPGVELNDNGQIKVNGEFVESLLLNGKQFLDGNNQLMLENIGAYTVKNMGYGVKELDTSDAIWNMRLTWSPTRNKHWIFMIDGFDMLHQLSNVNYAVSATGRTVSYSNALPRYVLFSVQYRLNIQPKKRK